MEIVAKIKIFFVKKYFLISSTVFLLGVILSGVSLLDIGFSRNYIKSLDDQNVSNNLVLTANIMTHMINSADKDLNHSFDEFTKSLKTYLPDKYYINKQEKLTVNGMQVPLLFNGKHLINLDHSVPDQLNHITGAVSTIFVRSGNDFIRVSTSLKGYDGKRAIGTSLDHKSQAYKQVIKGQSYIGPINLFGMEYLSKYIPIKDDQGEVIGIIFVGVDFVSHII